MPRRQRCKLKNKTIYFNKVTALLIRRSKIKPRNGLTGFYIAKSQRENVLTLKVTYVEASVARNINLKCEIMQCDAYTCFIVFFLIIKNIL